MRPARIRRRNFALPLIQWRRSSLIIDGLTLLVIIIVIIIVVWLLFGCYLVVIWLLSVGNTAGEWCWLDRYVDT
jgi:hypothetical protein